MLSCDDFEIDSLTFELRFDNAYLIWDRAGEVCAELLLAEPLLQFVTGQPNQQTLETKDVQINTELGALRVTCRGAKAHKTLPPLARTLTRISTNVLKVSDFTRIALRSISKKTYVDRATGVAAFTATAPSVAQKVDGFERVGLRLTNRYEDKVRGFLATIRLEEEEIKITVPWNATKYLTPVSKKETSGYLDCDYYTLGRVSPDSFDPEEWIHFAQKTIKRHFEGILK